MRLMKNLHLKPSPLRCTPGPVLISSQMRSYSVAELEVLEKEIPCQIQHYLGLENANVIFDEHTGKEHKGKI